MDEVTIYLDKTDKAQFCKWLSVYCKKKQVESRSYSYLDGWSYSLYYPFDIAPDFQNVLELTAMFARFTRIASVDETKEKYESEDYTIDKAVNVSWLEVGERMKLTLGHTSGRWACYPLFDILAEIGKDWQETRSEIWNYIQKQAEKYNIDLTGQPFPHARAQPENIIADSQGGTITYRRNEQGQTIPTGGAINPGYYAELGQGVAIKPDGQIRLNHTTGNFQPGLYSAEAKDSIIKVTSETLAGLTQNADTQAAKAGAAKPETTQPLPPINAEGLEKVRELSQQGLTVKVIAQRASLSESTVKRYRKILGLQRRK